MTLSKAPGIWRWEHRESSGWWRIHDELGIEDGPHKDASKERSDLWDAQIAKSRADGERAVTATLSAEGWSEVIDALYTALDLGRLSYEQRCDGSQLRDGLASLVDQVSTRPGDFT